MGQGADGEVVDTGRGHLARHGQRQPPARLQLGPAGDELHRPAQVRGREVVEQHQVGPGLDGEHRVLHDLVVASIAHVAFRGQCIRRRALQREARLEERAVEIVDANLQREAWQATRRDASAEIAECLAKQP